MAAHEAGRHEAGDGCRPILHSSPSLPCSVLQVYHYVVKSRADYAAKMARGDGMGTHDRTDE